MIKYLKTDPWKIIEEGFSPERQRASESIFSLGNGRFGLRANHEETYSGPSLQGSYVAGVYYPDRTRFGWWKIGFPEYFAKVLNSTNWIGIRVWLEGEEVDCATGCVADFRRELNMREGYLRRTFDIETPSGRRARIEALRFCSMADDETAAIRYTVTPLNFTGTVRFQPYLDGDVCNQDANYQEKFWTPLDSGSAPGEGWVGARTLKTEFDVAVAMKTVLRRSDGSETSPQGHSHRAFFAESTYKAQAGPRETLTLCKYVGLVSSLNHEKPRLVAAGLAATRRAHALGFDAMLAAQREKWAEVWRLADIAIEGDDEAQQGIRFNIFHLNQTYTGEDARLNIGPKGFTGEKYGGSTYWDTEAYCLPFYMSTKGPTVARQLLVYRYQQLGRAIENAQKLGFTHGAALYPMVTMNGEECHNEWEITFEEIHRNAAIAHAIHNYVRWTGDRAYLGECGLEVLIGIARFWAQRVHWSRERCQFVIHGVTGPNEFENNINNNWYTNYSAAWCLKFTLATLAFLRERQPALLAEKLRVCGLDEQAETEYWREIADNMYLGRLAGTRIFLQQDGFMDKDLRKASELDATERPISHSWSWDRVLRSCFIKQADVLQGLYFFENEFDLETIRENFEFYEPMTVHESSLSPCVHAILAARLGNEATAYAMYLRTSRLDLDDYNHEVGEGLHVTSMAGTWMSIVHGFGGMRVADGRLTFSPLLPPTWKSFSFHVLFRGKTVLVKVDAGGTRITET